FEKGVEGIGFALRRPAAMRARDMLPYWMMIERITRDLEAHILRQCHRQILFRHRDDPARAAMDDRDRATPIALPRNAPVAQPIGGRPLAAAQRLEPLGGGTFRRGDRES